MIYNGIGGWIDSEPEEAQDAEVVPERMAFREGGRAVVCLRLGLHFKTVTLSEINCVEGPTADKIIVFYAGTLAERLFDNKYHKSDSVNDSEKALFLAQTVAGTGEALSFFDQAAKVEAERLVKQNERTIRKVALALLGKKDEVMSYEEVKAACAS